MPNTVILVCGYKRTGKDTLMSILAGTTSRFHWRIYKHPSALQKRFDHEIYIRTAFADALKREAGIEYGIPLEVPDSDKDSKLYVHYQTGELVSARDIYIEWGSIRRSQDIDYWCKAAFNTIKSDDNAAYVVTDWRFSNEGNYVTRAFPSVITVRVYRSDVPEPDANIESEHQLDYYQTDFLLLSDGVDGEFERAVQKFPQYANYVECEVI